MAIAAAYTGIGRVTAKPSRTTANVAVRVRSREVIEWPSGATESSAVLQADYGSIYCFRGAGKPPRALAHKP